MSQITTIQTIEKYWEGKKVLITGGSAGLGKALAIKLSNMGSKVVVISRGSKKIDELKKEFPNIISIKADISDKEAIHKISGITLGELGHIDYVFNNASSLGTTPLRLLSDTECEDLEEVLQTNLLGPFRLIKALLPSMILSNSGTIVNISSDAANNAYETWGAYSISKIALDHMTKIWAKELSSHDLRMLAMDPGDMFTQMHIDAIPDANPDELYSPDDVAQSMIQFLAMDADFDDVVRFSASEWRAYLA